MSGISSVNSTGPRTAAGLTFLGMQKTEPEPASEIDLSEYVTRKELDDAIAMIRMERIPWPVKIWRRFRNEQK